MRDFLREHAGAVVVSVLLHGLLVGGILLATYISSQTHLPAVQPIPIDAVVVDSQVLHAAQRAKDERAEQEAARARAAAEAKAAGEQAEADARAAAEAEAVAATQEAKQAAKRAEQEADSAARAEAAKQAKAVQAAQAAEAADAAKAAAAEQAKAAQAERRADADKASAAAAAHADAAALDARRAAEAQKSAEARQAAEAKQAADAKRAAEERAKQDREAELRKQLADEERVSAVQSGPLRDRYIALLRNKIQNAWIKPPSATPGVDCLVQVTQVPGGEVTGARVTQCNGDAAVRQSIENAVYRASPLPDPPDPALFERNLSLRFRPNE